MADEQTGRIVLYMEGLHNPHIVEAFLERFSDAAAETNYMPEFHDGRVSVKFVLKCVAMDDSLREKLAKAGCVVTVHDE